jgi:hypothetical protein
MRQDTQVFLGRDYRLSAHMSERRSMRDLGQAVILCEAKVETLLSASNRYRTR